MIKQKIGVFGSTGSVGTQTLEVVKALGNDFVVSVLVANNNVDLLIKQAIEFKPELVVIANEAKYQELKDGLAQFKEIKILAGINSVLEAASSDVYNFMIAAISGFQGLFSVINAIKSKKTIGLVNKESIVVAGNIITQLAIQNNTQILPIDSEHSAIFQCLLGEKSIANIHKVILTASGGPFRGRKPNFLINVKKEHALKHPIWKMGEKISIDSATLMNKGLEIIEAKWLFNLKENQIEVLIHPESIIHSIVCFKDGNYKAQMSNPSMKFPIQFALTYPNRIPIEFQEIQFDLLGSLTLETPDTKTFKCLELARCALHKGGNIPCVLNSANEEAVDAFLNNKIKFLEIPQVIEIMLQKASFIGNPTLEEYILLDKETRIKTKEEIKKLHASNFLM